MLILINRRAVMERIYINPANPIATGFPEAYSRVPTTWIVEVSVGFPDAAIDSEAFALEEVSAVVVG